MTLANLLTEIGEKEVLELTREQVIDRSDAIDVASMEQALGESPSYTVGLAMARSPFRTDFSYQLLKLLSPYCQGVVLEGGPGTEDILYEMLGPIHDQVDEWNALDISTSVVTSLERKHASNDKYQVHQMLADHIGSIYWTKFDFVVGLAFMDSVFNFENIMGAVERKLESGGYFAHVQDCWTTELSLIRMLAEDDSMQQGVGLKGSHIERLWYDSEEFTIEEISIDHGPWVDAREYLTHRLLHYGQIAGLSPISIGKQQLTQDKDFHYVIMQK